MGQPMAGKLLYGAHQLTIHDISEATMVPLLASPPTILARWPTQQRAGVGSTPVSRSKIS